MCMCIRCLHEGEAIVNNAVHMVEKANWMVLGENNRCIALMKTWAAFLLHQMGFVKRRGNTKMKTTLCWTGNTEDPILERECKHSRDGIPPALVMNKQDKGLVTATFAETLIEELLPPQITHQGKTTALHLIFASPLEWLHITHSPNSTLGKWRVHQGVWSFDRCPLHPVKPRRTPAWMLEEATCHVCWVHNTDFTTLHASSSWRRASFTMSLSHQIVQRSSSH